MTDFTLIKNKEECLSYVKNIEAKDMHGRITITNKPDKFPCIATYSLINDSEGLRGHIKHITIKDIKKLADI